MVPWTRLGIAACALCLLACAKGSGGGFGGAPDDNASVGAHHGPSTSVTQPVTSTGSVQPAVSTGSTTTGGGGAGGAPVTATTTGPGSTVSTSASTVTSTAVTTATASSSTGVTACLNHLVISQVRSRGINGGNDEFIELFNPTAGDVTLDSTWTIDGRSSDSATYTGRWTGMGHVIPSQRHYLIVGTAYADPTAKDDDMTGIKDATSLVLKHGTSVEDAICFVWAAAQTYDSTYTCEGPPADNKPHDDSTAGNVDQSLERLQGGCADTANSSQDFQKTMPADPHNTSD